MNLRTISALDNFVERYFKDNENDLTSNHKETTIRTYDFREFIHFAVSLFSPKDENTKHLREALTQINKEYSHKIQDKLLFQLIPRLDEVFSNEVDWKNPEYLKTDFEKLNHAIDEILGN